uniref:AlNc14C29G2779 protein n=1 Tax=Albugo laibachii Nc14 TaxID=890382 RepID=F0W7G6_9STRA|nr:AlNc14C29G2779 [Albugo laibachii Nc14]|eukprot:CCA17067.1 AlNc14C29G2779 [Albugo laibachii Nc14]
MCASYQFTLSTSMLFFIKILPNQMLPSVAISFWSLLRVFEARRVSQSADGLVRPRNWNALGEAQLKEFSPVVTKDVLIDGVLPSVNVNECRSTASHALDPDLDEVCVRRERLRQC